MIPPAPPGDLDWELIYRRLMFGKGRYRPWEIDRMTAAEIALALDDDLETPRPPAGSDAIGLVAVQRHLAWRRNADRWELLVRATDKWET